MADISQNNPVKETSFALIGTALFLAMVLFIGVSAFLRPAGEHFAPIESSASTEETAQADDTQTVKTNTAEAEQADATDNASAQTVNTEAAQTEPAQTEPANQATAAPADAQPASN